MRAQVEPGTELESVESETADLEEVSLEDPPPAKRPGLATQAMQRMQRKAAPTKQSPSGAANLLGSGLARSETAPAADEESARGGEVGGEVGGELRRSFLSSVTFGYFQEVMSTGRRRALETGDLPPLPDEDRAQDIAVQFKRHYARSRRVDAALVATIGRPYLKAALFKLPHDCIVFLTPMLLKALIHLLEADEPNLSEGMLIVSSSLLTPPVPVPVPVPVPLPLPQPLLLPLPLPLTLGRWAPSWRRACCRASACSSTSTASTA